MKKLLIGTWLAVTASMVWASCVTNTYSSSGGRLVICQTCCYGSNCNTTCY